MTRDTFLQFLFGGKTSTHKSTLPSASKRKTLNLETLEDRHMLSVSFESPLVSTYVPDSAGVAVNPNLVDHRLLFSGDFNNDGKTDILTIQGSGDVHTYLNNMSTTSNPFSNAPVSAVSGLYRAVQAGVGKVTGGNNLDLLSANMLNNVLTITVIPGSSNGTFYAANTITSTWSGIQSFLRSYLPSSFNIPPNAIFDTGLGNISLVENSTGRIDSLICTVSYNIARPDYSTITHGTLNLVFTNDGTGKFTAVPTVLKAGTTEIPSAVIAAGDLTGNKTPDYVTINKDNANKLDIYLNNGTKLTTKDFGKEIGEVVIAKCHSTPDKMEIITALYDKASGKYSLCVITVTGTAISAYSEEYQVDIVPVNIVTGDFNNDGIYDIFISDGSMHQTLLGKSDGKFTKQIAVIANADFMAVYTADFDGDGNIDTLAVGKRFAWLIPGDVTKSPSVVVDFAALGISPKDVAFGDFNGDGKTDFAVLGFDGDKVHVFSNQTTSPVEPKFTRTSTLDVLFGKQVLVANFDNANGDDIVVYGYDDSGTATSSRLQTFLSNGSGGFNAAKTTTLNVIYDLLAVGEVTNDAYIDIVAVKNGRIGSTTAMNSHYRVLENNAANPGIFLTTRSTYTFGTTNTYPTAAAIGDMNGDGRNDLVLLDYDGKSVWILPQNPTQSGVFYTTAALGMKTFTVTGNNVEIAAFSNLALGDFHAAGVLDVLVGVVTTGGNTQFRVMENDPANKGTLKTDTNFTTVGSFDGANASSLVFHVGRLDDNGTADVIIVGGNTVKRFLNYDKSGAEIGTVELVFCDYTTARSTLSYVHEWQTFYVEVRANTGSATAGIRSFETVITFDPRFFEVRFDEIAWGPNVTATFTKGAGQIILKGTVSGTQGNNTNALLGYIAFRPSSDTRTVPLDFSNGAKPMENGFAVQQSTITTTTNATGQSRSIVSNQVPLFPVIYDNNGDGRIDAQDYTRFLQVYGMNVSSPSAEQYIRFCNYNMAGSSAQTIDAQDYTLLLQNFGLTKKAFRDDPKNPLNRLDFHNSFLTQTLPAAAPSMAAILFDESMALDEIFNVSSFGESMIQQTVTDQSTENRALMAYIASRETKSDEYDLAGLNPNSETERLLAEGKL